MANKSEQRLFAYLTAPALTGKCNDFADPEWKVEYDGQTDHVLWLILMGLHETLGIIVQNRLKMINENIG